MKFPRFVLFLTLISINSSYSADILAIFPTASVSHNAVYRTLTDELLSRGHRLTIITSTPSYNKNYPNVAEIDFSFMFKILGEMIDFNKWKEAQLDEVALLDMWINELDRYYEEQFKHPTIKQMIKMKENFKFDVIIVEFMNLVPWQAFATLFDAPIIGISPCDMFSDYHQFHGNVYNPILHPDFIFPFYENLTFIQRARVLRYQLWYQIYYKRVYNKIFENIIKRHIGNITVSVDQLNEMAEVLLVNAHPALDHVRPILPTTVQLGFMNIKDSKEIKDEEIVNFLEASNKPIIYMSLDLMVKSSNMKKETLDAFKGAFGEIPYDVMWKYQDEQMKDKSDNIFVKQWFPQADLLAHSRIKVFITQGGQQSMEEAIDRGIPLIVIPFAVDQHVNALRIEKLGIGISIDVTKITKTTLKAAIDKVINGDYTKNIKKLREIVRDSPMKPVKKAAWWIEYVIRHGGTLHLDYAGRHVPFWKSLMLDFIGIAVLAFHIFVKILTILHGKFFERRKIVKKIKDKKNTGKIE